MSVDQERRIRTEVRCTGSYVVGMVFVVGFFLDHDSVWWSRGLLAVAGVCLLLAAALQRPKMPSDPAVDEEVARAAARGQRSMGRRG